MKRLLIIPLLLLSLTLSATKYYIATTGNDAAAGTIGSPWKTWSKITTGGIAAGDTVYIRGGTYGAEYAASSVYQVYWNGLTGTATDTIKIWAYPGESPVMDLDGVTYTSNYIYTLYIRDCDYVHIKGLRVTNSDQSASVVNGLTVWYIGLASTHVLIEDCEADNSGGWGFRLSAHANQYIYFKNCDAHHLADPYTTYGGSDGFQVGGGSLSTNIFYDGCRAWSCSDDGWDFYRWNGYAELNNCQVFWNGYSDGGNTAYNANLNQGNGFKLGPANSDMSTTHLRTLTNCISVNNKRIGITHNVNSSYPYTSIMWLYNNVSYSNGSRGYEFSSNYGTNAAYIIRNNVSYQNSSDIGYGTNTVQDHNTWNGAVTVTSADFRTLIDIELDDAREADGSLKVMDLLHLVSTSDLIGAGIDVDLTYDADGEAWEATPSMGAWEYIDPASPIDPITLTTTRPYWTSNTTAVSGGNVIDDGGATVTARGVCWNTTGTPDTGDSKTSDGSGTGAYTSTMTGLNKANTYYVRAYATNSAGTAYGDEYTFRDRQMLGKGGKALISKDGKQLIIQ